MEEKMCAASRDGIPDDRAGEPDGGKDVLR
jgi:hypothetical protein